MNLEKVVRQRKDQISEYTRAIKLAHSVLYQATTDLLKDTNLFVA